MGVPHSCNVKVCQYMFVKSSDYIQSTTAYLEKMPDSNAKQM